MTETLVVLLVKRPAFLEAFEVAAGLAGVA
jgi:hypothetical protein